MEARLSHSLLAESTPTDHLSDTKHNNEVFENEDNYMAETPMVLHKYSFIYFLNFHVFFFFHYEDCATHFIHAY